MTTYDPPGAEAGRRWRRAPVLAAVGAAVTLALATTAAVTLSAAGDAAPVAASAPVAVPVLDLPGEAAGGRLPWAQPLTVTVTDGELLDLDVRGPDGAALVGDATAGSLTTWRSTGTLVPDSTYAVLARVRDGAGVERWLAANGLTAPAEQTLGVVLSPGDGAVVGVGMPVVLRLDRDVEDAATRAALVARLAVTATPAVDGAWRWMSDREVHYRPAQFWAPGTTVSVRADLAGLALPDGVWGAGVRTSDYTIGDAIVSTVDVAAHTMTVTRNGEVLRVLPASMGRPEFPTRGGVHLVLEKEASKVMNSDTVGLPGAYRTKVEWAVRITYSGTFTHSAPWSVRDQGVRNVSHGCINLSPADAKWFYDLSRRGDVVEVVNAGVGPLLSDPGAAHWNLPFEQWKAPA